MVPDFQLAVGLMKNKNTFPSESYELQIFGAAVVWSLKLDLAICRLVSCWFAFEEYDLHILCNCIPQMKHSIGFSVKPSITFCWIYLFILNACCFTQKKVYNAGRVMSRNFLTYSGMHLCTMNLLFTSVIWALCFNKIAPVKCSYIHKEYLFNIHHNPPLMLCFSL